MVKPVEETNIDVRIQNLKYAIDTFTDVLIKGCNNTRGFLELLERSPDITSKQIGSITYNRVTDLLFTVLRMKASMGDINKAWYEADLVKEFDLEEELQRIANQFSTAALVKKYQFHYSFSDEIPKLIQTDRLLLARILFMWLDNIDCFATTGSRVSMQVSTEFNDYLCIKITDNVGCLKRQDIEDLFSEEEPKSSNQRVMHSNGLFLSQKMAASMGGKIELTPSPSGLIFCLYIPY